MKLYQLLCLVALIIQIRSLSVQLQDPDSESLYKTCFDLSKCDDLTRCQIEHEHCQRCDNLQYENEVEVGKNKERYECIKDCLYQQVDMDEDDEITDESFDFLFCLKSAIFSHDEYQQPKNVYVIKQHHLVKKVFEKYQNWNIVDSPQFSNWHFKWDFYHRRLNYSKPAQKYQIGNKIENLQEVLGDKVELLNLLRNYDQNEFYDIKTEQFFPQTYVIDLLKNQQKQEKNLYQQTDKFWIVKTPSGYGGEGIIILETMEEVKIYLKESKQKLQAKMQENKQKQTTQPDTKAIVQKYIENPMLINNKKFDIRSFALVACTEPFLVLYHDGYFRKTFNDFDMKIKPWNLQTKLKHLTNSHIQEKSKKWQDQKLRQEHGMSYEQSYDFIKKEQGLNDEQIEQLNLKMQQIISYSFTAAIEKLKRYPGSFHLTGFDFMFDDQQDVIFLEANQNPRLQAEFNGEKNVSPKIAESTVDIVLQILQIEDIRERTRLLKNVNKYFDLKGWKVLINEAEGYNLLDDDGQQQDDNEEES